MTFLSLSSCALVSEIQTKVYDPRIDRPSEWIRARSLNSYFACCKIVVKMNISPLLYYTPNMTPFWGDPQGPGGYSQKIWVGVCGPLPKTLILFMTKICNFPYPIYDLTKSLIPYLWPESSCCWLYLACVAGVKRGREKQSADGRRRAWWKSSFF